MAELVGLTPKSSLPPAPAHLSAASKRLWRELVGDYGFDPAGLAVLKLACEALDRGEQARRELAKHKATTYTDRFGAPRMRPEVAVERDARLAAGRLLNLLGLEAEREREPLALRPRRSDQR